MYFTLAKINVDFYAVYLKVYYFILLFTKY